MTQELDTHVPQMALPRREFLKMAAAGGAALALSSIRLDALAANKPKGKHQCHSGKCSKCGKSHDPGKCKHSANSPCPISNYNATTKIEAKDFPNLATVEGISQNQLTQHLGLYQGYVKKINTLTEGINSATLDLEAMNGTYSPYREMHLEQTYALNGVVLHEYYFENIGGPKTAPTDQVKEVFTKEFGSWENYINHLTAVAKSARGWAITGYNMRDHRIHNYLLDTHNQFVPVHVLPLLVLDVYEHAYMIDFGTKRGDYLTAFINNIDWAPVDQRLKMMMLHG